MPQQKPEEFGIEMFRLRFSAGQNEPAVPSAAVRFWRFGSAAVSAGRDRRAVPMHPPPPPPQATPGEAPLIFTHLHLFSPILCSFPPLPLLSRLMTRNPHNPHAMHTKGGLQPPQESCYLRGPQARRYTQNAVHTQGGAHKRRSIATAGVMLLRGAQARRYTQNAVHTQGGTHRTRCTRKAVHTKGGL